MNTINISEYLVQMAQCSIPKATNVIFHFIFHLHLEWVDIIGLEHMVIFRSRSNQEIVQDCAAFGCASGIQWIFVAHGH
jgi:hypothetical protein